jgi:hypothetical protein
MSVLLRVLRVVAIVWALVAVIGMGQAVRPSMEGQSMLADWAKSFGWLLGLQLHWTGTETPEGLRALLTRSVLQVFFYFGWIGALLVTRAHHKHGKDGEFGVFERHSGIR